jgi:hypothetical protein
MRYYNIDITDTNGLQLANFSTLTGGQTNGAALKVEVEVFQTFFATPAQNSYIKIYGIDYSQISQATNFNDQIVTISVGMSPGLPLASAQPPTGPIVIGTIFQAFGNWQGNLVTLDLIVLPYIFDTTKEVNLSGTWAKGSKLSDNVDSVLGTVFPKSSLIGSFSPNLVLPETQPYLYTSLEQFSRFVYSLSKSIIIDSAYMGANIASNSTGFVLTDGTPSSGESNSYNNPVVISIYDVIGNLTWIDAVTIQAKVVMRSDLSMGQFITFPKGFPISTNSNTYVQTRNNMSFQGVFMITLIHHSGDSRQADANSWVTIINAVIIPAPTS